MKMDPVVRQMLTNPNFDFSSITKDDCISMITFWRHRFADPHKIYRMWFEMLYYGNYEMWSYTGELLIAAVDRNPSKLTEDQKRIAWMWEAAFKKPETMEPLDDLDLAAVEAAHPNWR
jgi:hypothetical protein